MRNFIKKIDNDNGEAGVVVADEYNSIFEEAKNVVKPFFELSEMDNKQMAKSINAFSKSLVYETKGDANNIILTRGDVLDAIDALFNGMVVVFSPKYENASSVTIKVGQAPTRIVVDHNGAELKGGELKVGGIYFCLYKDDKFYISKIPSVNDEELVTPMAFGASDNSLKSLLDSTKGIPVGTKIVVDGGDVVESVVVSEELVTKGGANIEKLTARDIVVTVGVGGDFSTINQALYYLDGLNRTQGKFSKAGINLLTGFVLREQVIVRSKDLSWIEINSVDAVVSVDASRITKVMMELDDVVPAFGGVDGAKLPMIGALFDYGDNSTAKDGVAVYGDSSVAIRPECGINNCRRGIQAYNGSKVVCNIDGLRSLGGLATSKQGVSFKNCSGRALDLQQGSSASLPRSNFNDCKGDTAVYLIWGCNANLYQSQARNAKGTAFLARDGSVLCIRECDMDNAGDRAVHALHGALIDARAKKDGSYGVNGAKNCRGSIAVLANGASVIEADELNTSGAAARGFSADSASIINASGSNATNCTTFGFLASNGSTINAAYADASGSGTGFNATQGGIINANNSTATNCNYGALAESCSTINVRDAMLDGCLRSVEARDAGKVNAYGASCKNTKTRAISILGGEAVIGAADTTGALGFHLTVRNGGRVSAYNFQGDIDVRDGGGFVHNELGTGTVSQTANSVTKDGIIFR